MRLHADGKAKRISEETENVLRCPAAIDVLLDCVDHPDPNVRWAATNLLGRINGFTLRVMPGLRKALKDEDPNVRLLAVIALGGMGANARIALADLALLLHDPEAHVGHVADLALWEIDATFAQKACAWKVFSSKQWRFSASFPLPPVEKQSEVERWGTQTHVHSFTALDGPRAYVVAISEYPSWAIKNLSERERAAAACNWLVGMTAGKVLHEGELNYRGLKGHELEIEVANIHAMRIRFFWVGPRLYQVMLTFSREFLNPRAAEHFFESFQIVGHGPSGA